MMDPFPLDFIPDNPFDDDFVCSMFGRKDSILGSPVKGCPCHPCPVEDRMLILCLDSDEVGEVEVERGNGGGEGREVEREGSLSMGGRSQTAALAALEWLRKDGASNKFHNFLLFLLPSTFLLLPVLTDVAD